MNLEELRYEVDEELREEEREEIKASMKKKSMAAYWRMAAWRKSFQNIKCLFGKHLYNHIPSLNIRTCPCCTRIWNGLKGDA